MSFFNYFLPATTPHTTYLAVGDNVIKYTGDYELEDERYMLKRERRQ